MRNEQEVFDDLAKLCSRPGYVHALAFISYKDNYVGYIEEVTAENMLSMFSKDRLIRTELCTLIGLLVKTNIDFTRPSAQVAQTYIERTYTLLEELHQTMSEGLLRGLREGSPSKECKPFSQGQVLREPIFYSGESAYSFQYRDLSVKKYAADSAWLEENKGFSIEAARDVVRTVQQFQNERLAEILHSLPALPLDEWTLLPGFTFEVSDISATSKIDAVVIEHVLN